MRTINSVGPDAHAGFLHEMALRKNSLAYDLQEPFRFLVDLAVISLVKNEISLVKNEISLIKDEIIAHRTGVPHSNLIQENSKLNMKLLPENTEINKL